MGFLIGWLAAAVNQALGDGDWRGRRTALVCFAATLALVLIGGSLRLAFLPTGGPYVRVAGIAPAPSALPRAAGGGAAASTVIERLFAETRQAAASGAEVVTWSENAAVPTPADEPPFLLRAAAVARQAHIYLNVADNVPGVRDETHFFGPDGRLLWTYEKHHPIPRTRAIFAGVGRCPGGPDPIWPHRQRDLL